MEDAGALPFECNVDGLNTGDVIDIDVGYLHPRHTRLDHLLSFWRPRKSMRLNESPLMAQDSVTLANRNCLSSGDAARLTGPRYIVRRFL